MSVAVCVPLFNRTRCSAPRSIGRSWPTITAWRGTTCFKAQTYRDHAKARYGVQLPLFDADDGERDGDPEASCHDRVHRPADT